VLGSAIPKTNPKAINKKLRKVKELKTPLTSFNQREKQFKRSLSGTYGKGYNEVTSEEARVTRMRIEQDRVTRREQADKKKEFHEHIKDIGFESQSAIPNSYLF
jgi:hypothetical protein